MVPRVENMTKGIYVYRYSVGMDGGPFRIIRDFSQQREFVWSPALREHEAKVRVTVRNNESKDTAEAEVPFRIVSRVKGSAAVVTPTAHPLIALFSAPPCPDGSNFRVAFHRAGEEVSNYTPLERCRASQSNNVYVAGMRADSDYRLRAEVVSGQAVSAGAWMPLHTGLLSGGLPPVTIVVPHAAGTPAAEPILISAATSVGGNSRPFATDLEGNVVWYLPAPDFLTRVLPGGHFLVHSDGMNSATDIRRWQVLRELDLAGNVVRETNVSRVAEQLESRGIHSDCRSGGKECVCGFHHEAIRLPNGHTFVIAGIERIFLPASRAPKSRPIF